VWLFSEKSGAKVYDAAEIASEVFSDIVPDGSALAIDGIDGAAGDTGLEESLFHVINYARECGTKLFMTMTEREEGAKFVLPDLRSRVAEFPVAAIYLPDDDFLKSLVVKQFSERGIAVGPELVEFVTKQIPRNGMVVKYLVERADSMAAAQGCKITVPFIKKIIEEIE
jgi:chromosomal replication initiation ATPase DnaA